MSSNRLVKGRWYPTAVVLGDGRVAVFSGRPDRGIEDTAEVINPESLKSELIDGGKRKLYIYPGMVMVPGGDIFYVPTAWQYEGAGNVNEVKAGLGPTASFRMTGATTGTWSEHDDPIDPTERLFPANFLREEGTFVLLPPARAGRIMVIGGGFATDPNDNITANQVSTQMDSCEILHTQGAPHWTSAGRMRRPRSNVHAVVLPDGKVLIVGGHDGAKRVHTNDQNIPEMFDPTVPPDPADPHAAFTDMATMGSSRLYHAAALLLPDARVLVAGAKIKTTVTYTSTVSHSTRSRSTSRPTAIRETARRSTISPASSFPTTSSPTVNRSTSPRIRPARSGPWC